MLGMGGFSGGGMGMPSMGGLGGILSGVKVGMGFGPHASQMVASQMGGDDAQIKGIVAELLKKMQRQNEPPDNPETKSETSNMFASQLFRPPPAPSFGFGGLGGGISLPRY